MPWAPGTIEPEVLAVDVLYSMDGAIEIQVSVLNSRGITGSRRFNRTHEEFEFLYDCSASPGPGAREQVATALVWLGLLR